MQDSSSLAGQIAAVESGLGPLEPMEVAVYRSRASLGSKPVDSLYGLLIKTLRMAG